MDGLLIFLLALNVGLLVAVTAFYRRAKKRRESRRVEAPNSEHASRYVRDVESRQRWEEMDRSLLHEVNREEFDRVLAKLQATSVRALTDGERAFLDRMLEAERRVQKALRRERHIGSLPARSNGAGEAQSREKGNEGNGGGAARPVHGTS